jgi:predicted ATPase/signal transduction histidine kinase
MTTRLQNSASDPFDGARRKRVLDAIGKHGFDASELIAIDERFALLRARRPQQRSTVLVKVALVHPVPALDAADLARECEILEALSVDRVPRVIEYVRDDRFALLAHEDPGGVTLRALTASGLPPVDRVLSYAVQLTVILGRLHREGIIHRGIRPHAILVGPESERVLLTDFTDAARNATEASTPLPVRAYGGRLPYVAPEQTGRLNRATDYRCDFYSLGVLMYELLCGQPPFVSDDPLELIHGHIAKIPPAPSELNSAVPRVVSQIVMKLLAKSVEDRYQSATGLRIDLEECAAQWSRFANVQPFVLGARDVSEQFTIADRLYGREPDLASLLAAFERYRHAGPGIMLVAGNAGVGKSALIEALRQPVAEQRGYFIAGKFDQRARGIPYHALIQAFQGFIAQLLTEPFDRLQSWRDRIQDALKENAGVIAEMIPEVELIIGTQPPPAAVGPQEAENRFRRVFERFVAVLTTEEQPLVLFLDDLQWADTATLNLLEPLLSSSDIRSLFVIGAYRVGQVDETHPLRRIVQALEQQGAPVHQITVTPLKRDDIARLIADTMHCTVLEAADLAQVVLAKTAGNPFITIQFLQALHQDGLITFDVDQSRWVAGIDAIRSASVTENVVELMSRKIDRLGPAARTVLTHAACIGNRFELNTLATVTEQSADETRGYLSEAVAAGLVIPDGHNQFQFLHDRVQQAAYARIPDARKPEAHLAAGRLLWKSTPSDQIESEPFDIASHLNIGAHLITQPDEKRALANLNLVAGRKARQSTAHEAALGYFKAGVNLLDESAWRSDYELAFSIHLEFAQCEYLCGDFNAAETHLASLLLRTKHNLDKATVHSQQMVQYENVARYADALATARTALSLFGVSFPQAGDAKQAALEDEIAAIDALIAGRPIQSLIDLPVMTNPSVQMVVSILTTIWSSTYILGDTLLARLVSATIVRLSLVHGNTAESAYGYVTHAITVGPVRQDYAAAYEFGSLALKVNELFNDLRRRAKIHQQFHAHVNLWCRSMQSCVLHAREATRSGLEAGDFIYATYGAATEAWPAFASTQDLAQFVRDGTVNLALVRKLKNAPFADMLSLTINWAEALRGGTESPVSLTNASFAEEAFLANYGTKPFFLLSWQLARLHLLYSFGMIESAVPIARALRAKAQTLIGNLRTVLFDFWSGLTLAAHYGQASASEREDDLRQMQDAQRSFAVLARSCPENFLCQSLLLSAEIERVTGHDFAAEGLFEQAIGYANDTGMVQHQALAKELYGGFWLGRGNRKIASLYLREARAHYASWGADAKVRALTERHGELLDVTVVDVSDRQVLESPVDSRRETLDLSTIVKAAHAVTRNIELEAFLKELLRITIENAGARQGVLIEERDGRLFVVAHRMAEGGDNAVLPDVAIDADAPKCSSAVVNYVYRTKAKVVVAEATADGRFAQDPYVLKHRPRSILCLPVMHQGKLGAILYLENDLTGDAFSPVRIEAIEIISAQAAISLENARLFEGMRRENAERRRVEAALKQTLDEIEQLKNRLQEENVYLRREMIANISHDLRTPVTLMQGYLDTLLLKEKTLGAAERRGFLEVAARQSRHLGAMVGELIELAKLDFSGYQINREPVHLGELAQDVVQMFQLAAQEKEIRLEARIHPDVSLAHADMGLIERALENLLGNAIEHTERGGRVKLTVVPANDRIRVEVSDTGKGIAAEHLPHIFQRFYRVNQSRHDKSGGAGLGLAIVLRIMELHESQIAVESKVAEGTTFSFALPVATLH